MQPPATPDDLLTLCESYRLLDADQAADARGTTATEAKALAAELIRIGRLTPFQINQLFQGRGAALQMGNYVLLEKLGEGGMGAVFKARNWKLDTVVALKVIRKERLESPQVMERFRREILATARLNHPNIVRALDAEEVGDNCFLVMEYVPGRDLATLVKKDGPCSIADACAYIRDAALGLQHAHDRGMVHRDIKPANLLLTRTSSGDAQVKILDFGLARLASDEDRLSTITQEGTVMGTVDFMAPEQGEESHGVDIRADLYSLGCSLYFLLTGQVVFPGGTLVQKLRRHLTDPPPALEARRTDVPVELASLYRKLLAKKPDDRPPTPGLVADSLDRIRDGLNSGLDLAVAPFASEQTELLVRANPAVVVEPSIAAGAGTILEGAELPKRTTRPWNRAVIVGGLFAAMLLVLVLVVRPWAGREDDEDPKDDPRPKIEGLEARLDDLTARLDDPAQDRRALRSEYLALPWESLSPVRRLEVMKALRRLPSPWDRFDATSLRSAARLDAPIEKPSSEKPTFVGSFGDAGLAHWGGIWSLGLSPDGTRMASGGEDHASRLWDTRTRDLIGVERSTFVEAVSFIAFDRQGTNYYAADSRGRIRAAEVKTDKTVWRMNTGDVIDSIAVSPDGKLLAVAGRSGSVSLYDTAAGAFRRKATGLKVIVNALAFVPDRNTLVMGCNEGKLYRWRLAKADADALNDPIPALNARILAVAANAGGTRLAVTGEAQSVVVWDLEKNALHRRISSRRNVQQAQFVGNSDVLVFAPLFEGKIRFVNVETGNETGTIDVERGDGGKYIRIAVSANGLRFAVAQAGPQNRLDIRLFDAVTLKELSPSPETFAVEGVAVDPSGRWAAWKPSGGPGGSIRLVDLDRAEGERERIVGGDRSIGRMLGFLPPPGKWARLAVWKPGEWGIIDSESQTPEFFRLPLKDPPSAHAVSPDGRLIAFAFRDATVHLLDVKSGSPALPPIKVSATVSSMAFDPSGSWLATADGVDAVKRWSVETGKPTASLNHPKATHVVVGTDGRTVATGSADGIVMLWDTTAPAKPRMKTTSAAPLIDLDLSPDVTTAAAFSGDRTLRIWDINRLAFVREWSFPGDVRTIAYMPDSRHLLTANGNGTVSVLRIAP